MKTSLLPGIDLARTAVQLPEVQRRTLEAMKLKRPPYSYDPMRRSILDVLHVSAGPLAAHSPTPWDIIERGIMRAGRSEDERRANLQAAKALRAFADEQETIGRKQEFFPLALGITAKVEYWSPAVVSIGGRPTVLFIDPRRTKRLTSEGRRFVHSVMSQRIREADPDYADVELGIIQFDNDSDERHARIFLASDQELFTFDELNMMVQQTYAIWQEVQRERESAARRTGTGGKFFEF